MELRSGEQIDGVEEEEEEETGYELEMNWNIGHFLPKDASCQDIFKVQIGGHIQALYEKIQEQMTATSSQVRITVINWDLLGIIFMRKLLTFMKNHFLWKKD